MTEKTTVTLRVSTLERLKPLGKFRESYDTVINRVLDDRDAYQESAKA